jgi:hypothetical protein
MKRLERLVIHVEEAVRLGSLTDEAHLRLGLVLLDSAAELLMHRETDRMLETDHRLLRVAEACHEWTGRGENDLNELRARIVSGTRRKKIEREFGAKCDYLMDRGLLAGPQVRVLKKLHDYRNETYHRDKVRPPTLASAVKIYTYLVCVMMRDFPAQMICISSSDPSEAIAKYLEDHECGLGLLGLDLQARIATSLLDQSGVAEPLQLGEALAQHISDRFDQLEDAAAQSAAFFNQLGVNESWDFDTILCLVQLKSDELRRIRSSEDARAVRVPVRAGQIKRWRRAGDALAMQTNDLAAFAAFADLEDAFEPTEALVIKLAMDVDRKIQMQVDAALGK